MAKKKQFKFSNNSLLNALLYIAVGILFCVFRSSMLNILMTVVGVLFIVYGIVSIVNKDTVTGVVSIAIGAIIILGGWLFVEIILIIFGI